MAALRGNDSAPSLPAPRPKSPPQYPDLYGKRRDFAKVQMLEREIGFLEEELKLIEGLHPASRSCKEVFDFVMANGDPLILTTKKTRKSCRFWKWLCRVSCFNFSWICCCSSTPHLELPCCCHCNCHGNCNTCNSCGNPCCCHCNCHGNGNTCNCCGNPCCTVNCRIPKCHCSSCWNCRCFSKPKCSSPSCCSCSCCALPKCSWSCPSCSCKRFCTCYPKCLKFNICSSCHNICCYPCYFCH